MLNNSTVAVVADTAAMLAEKNLRLVPVEGTPLAALVAASLKNAIVVSTIGGAEAASAPSFEELLEASANDADALGGNEHDSVMDNAIQAVSQAINFNNQLARNVVNPMIERVATAVQGALESVASNAAMPIEIVQVNDRSFWSTPYIHEMFSRFEETPVADVAYTGPAVAWDDTLAMTGVATLDDAIRGYLAELKSDGTLEAIWKRTFGIGPFKASDAFSGDRFATIDVGLVTYLAASTLAQNPPADTEMSAKAWETMLTDIRVQAGRCVQRGMSWLLRARERNELIRQYPTSTAVGEKIYVDSEVYRRFLESGGAPEVLFGALFSDRNRDYRTLLEKQKGYGDKWRVIQAALGSEAVGRRLEAAIIALEKAVAQEINTLDEQYLVVSRQQLHKSLHESLKMIGSRALEDLWTLSRKTICRVIFPHTDAEATLSSIDEQKRLRPELDIREAATYAAIDQLAKWMAKLIRVDALN